MKALPPGMEWTDAGTVSVRLGNTTRSYKDEATALEARELYNRTGERLEREPRTAPPTRVSWTEEAAEHLERVAGEANQTVNAYVRHAVLRCAGVPRFGEEREPVLDLDLPAGKRVRMRGGRKPIRTSVVFWKSEVDQVEQYAERLGIAVAVAVEAAALAVAERPDLARWRIDD